MAHESSVEDRINESTLYLLRTGGPQAATVEAVAGASGVAKTTIYRRYRDRREMLAAALSHVASPLRLEPQTAPSDRMRWIIRHAIGSIEDGVGLGGVAAMLTDVDPEFNALFRRILVEQRGHLTAAIEAGKADGSLRADIDSATLIDAVVGAYIAEHARSEHVEDGWEERLFEFFWPAVRPSQGDGT